MTLDDKVRTACHRIEELYYETGGKCYVSFSGGKDSTVLLALIKLCEEVYTIPEGGIPAVFSNTGIELGVTVDFVKWCKDSGWYKNVQVIRPDVSFDWVIKNKGKPIKSKIRARLLNQFHRNATEACVSLLVHGETLTGKKKAEKSRLADKDFHMLHDDFPITPSHECCEYMKKLPFRAFEKGNDMKGAITGVRVEEGGARALSAKNRIATNGKICTFSKGVVTYKMPIIDWSDKDVEEFIKTYHVPLSDAYSKYGHLRTGCMACPFAMDVDKDLEYLYFYEPNRYKAAMHWLGDVYIAQNVVLPFDEAYERERERTWRTMYEPMRQEMLRKYRPNSRLIKGSEQLSLFDEVDEP